MTYDYDFCYISELSNIDRANADDLFIVSQLSGLEYVTKNLKYSALCSSVLQDIDDKVSSSVSSSIAELSGKVEQNIADISALSGTSDKTVSAVVKMANCIQANKANISALSDAINLLAVTGENGISVGLSEKHHWNIGHENNIPAKTVYQFAKIKYDSHGHITDQSDVTSADILELGNFISGATSGIAVNSRKQVYLKPAAPTAVGGVIINNSQSSDTNIMVSETGVISAVNTTYSAGMGLNLDGTVFSLVEADAANLGGVKVDNSADDNNLRVLDTGVLSARDTTYSSATPADLGLVKTGYITDDEQKKYKVELDDDDNAYVHVPWENTVPSFYNNTLSVEQVYQTISSVQQENGNIIRLGYSTALYDKMREISASNASASISSCVRLNGAAMTFEPASNSIQLYCDNDLCNMVCQTEIPPLVIDGAVVSAKYIMDSQGHQQMVQEGAPYLMLNMTGATVSSENIFISLSDVQDTFVTSAWYDAQEKVVKISFNDPYKDIIRVPVSAFAQDLYTGREGDIMYATPQGVKKQPAMNTQVYVCETDDEIRACTNAEFSFKSVFENWQKCGTASDNRWYGYTSDYPDYISGGIAANWDETTSPTYQQLFHSELRPATKVVSDYGYPYWIYNDYYNSIVQPANTNDYSFYVSLDNMMKFDITFISYSMHTDDDINSFILFSDSDQNNPHTLNFIRTPNHSDFILSSGYHWSCIADMYGFHSIPQLIVSENTQLSTSMHEAIGSWNNLGFGTKIRVRRNDNMISAWATPFKTDKTIQEAVDEAFDDRSAIIINLNTATTSGGYPIGQHFRNGSKIGFGTLSQAYSIYKVLDFKVPRTIIDMRSNQLSVYDPITDTWERDRTRMPVEAVGVGRFTKNIVTGKTFYTNTNSFMIVSNSNGN